MTIHASRDDVRIAAVLLEQIRFHDHNVRRDLGDLRSLTDSIRRFGVMQPVVLENRGDHLRLRAGHRRVAAARLAGLQRIPAVIHGDSLDTDEWLVHAVQENVIRQGLSPAERNDVVLAMRAEGMSWKGVGEAFGVGASTARRWVKGDGEISKAQVRREHRQEQVDDLTSQGRSAAAIADQLGMSERHVVRYRSGVMKKSGGYSIGLGTLRNFAITWREHATTHDITVTQLLDALDQVVADRRVGDALPEPASGQQVAS